jgi:hypothetical protein
MNRRSWIRKLFTFPATRTIRKAPARVRRPGRPRLVLEVLEDRTIPSITATGVPGWTAQGPAMLNTQQFANAPWVQAAGAVESIAVNPNNPAQIIAGTANGGVWRTIDTDPVNPGAVTWRPLTDQLSSQSIGVVAYDPNDATGNTLYAGTGLFTSSFTNGGSAVGLYRTQDGGDTWTLLGNNAQGVNILAGNRIKALAITGQTILVGTIDGNGNSLSENRNYEALGGKLFRSTDGGTTFSQVLASGLPSGAVTSIVVDPNNPATPIVNASGTDGGPVIITTNNPNSLNTGDQVVMSGLTGSYAPLNGRTFTVTRNTGTRFSLNNTQSDGTTAAGGSFRPVPQVFATVAGNGVYRSTNGGATWNPFNSGLTGAAGSADVEVVAQNIGGVTTLFAGVSREFPNNNPATATLAVFKASNLTATGSWTALAATPTGFNAGVGSPEKFQLATDPTNAGVVYIDGQGGTSVFRYNPAGTGSWVQIDQSGAKGTAPHADSRDLRFLNNSTLLEADDGGIYVMQNPTNAASSSWNSLNGNLANIEVTSVAYDSTNQVYYAGTQDNGSPHQDGTNSLNATALTGGDGNFQAVDTTSLGNGNVLGYSESNNYQFFFRNQYTNANTINNPTEVEITNATNTSPITITVSSSALNLQTDQGVRIHGVQGNTAANGNWVITVVAGTGGTQFTLNGTTGNGAYLGGGKAARLLQITTISGVAGQPIRITTTTNHGFQTGDQVLIRDPGAPYGFLNNNNYYVTRISDTQFSLNGTVANGMNATGGRVRLSNKVMLKSAIGEPNLSGLNAADQKFAAEGSFNQHPFVLNSVDPRMMLLGFSGVYEDAGAVAITGASNASPIVITSPNHGLQTGERVVIRDVQGNTAANGTWVVTRLDANRFSLNGSDGTLSGVYEGGGTWIRSVGFAGDVITNISANFVGLNGRVSTLAYGGRRDGMSFPNVAFVGTTSGQLFFRGETGASFTDVSAALASRGIYGVALDPADWRRVYVVTNTRVWFTPNITDLSDNPFQTLGGGPEDNLTSLIAPLGSLAPELRSIAIVGSNGQPGTGTVVVGGLGGVYRRLTPPAGASRTATWSKYGSGLPNVVVTSMVYNADRDTLVVGTMGRGVWTLANASTTITISGLLTVTGNSVALASRPLALLPHLQRGVPMSVCLADSPR